jgi:hypothetical protein
MADREESTRPPLSNVFRESFLAVLERPEHEAAFRVVGEVLHDLAYEGRRLLAGPERGTGTDRTVRGATGDLMQAFEQLADLGRLVEEANLPREEARLLLVVGDTASDMQPIMARLNAAFTDFASHLPAE